jgi:hypothetical protein
MARDSESSLISTTLQCLQVSRRAPVHATCQLLFPTDAFTDYRVPQQLHNLGVLVYSPPLSSRIRRLEELPAGSNKEIELRGCSIWAVELMRRQIVRDHPESEADVHAVLLDFLMYDLAKEVEIAGKLHTRALS